MDEKALIKKSKNGDSEAFELLITPYMTKVYNIALGILGSSEDAEDAAQEAFIKAFRNIGSFNENSGLYTWLYRIVYNCCLDMIRKKQRRPFSFLTISKGSDDDSDFEIEIADSRPLPDEILSKTEMQGEVRRAVSMLKESYRTIIVMRDFEGLSYDEIADVLGISLGTVKSRISRGRESLKNIIVKNFPELFDGFGVK